MSLVAYPDSDSDAEEADESNATATQPTKTIPKSPLKRKRRESKPEDLPPLPPAFHDLYASNARVSTADDPSLHGGRKRAIPHVEGNWPTHVYLEWIPLQAESDRLHSLIDHVKQAVERHNEKQERKSPIPEIKSSLQSELGVSLPLHISLSRTLQIKTQDREEFLEALRSSLRKAAVQIFHFDFLGLKWVPNYERNRWFLVLSIKQPEHDELNRLLVACNEAAKKGGHSGLYTGSEGDGPMPEQAFINWKKVKSQNNKSGQIDYSKYFHISIAWNLTEPDSELISIVESVTIDKYVRSPQKAFDAVKVRIGNAVHRIELRPERGFLEKRHGSIG